MSIGGETIRVISREAPLLSLIEILRLALSTKNELSTPEQIHEITLWSSPSDEWQFIGINVTVRLTAEGPSRFSLIQEQAKDLFSRIVVDGPSAPIKLFGGASFEESSTKKIWQDFASADFILPQWCYARNQERAFIWSVSPFLRHPRSGVGLGGGPSENTTRMDSLLQVVGIPHDRHTGNDGEKRGNLGGESNEPSEMTLAQWSELVNRALAAMRQDTLSKVVLSRCSKIKQPAPQLAEIAARMLSAYPSCAHFMIGRGSSTFIGSTPEKLVALSRGKLTLDALAGTTPTTTNPEEFLRNDKERREHQHVIDGIKSALAPFSITLEHALTPQIKTLPNVLHLHTPMQATLSQPTHILSLVDALHPTPAVCGAPKEAARRWILQNEPHSRGWYAAPVGHFDSNGEGSFFVAIRSALIQPSASFLYAGAGLVLGSEPEREYEETAAKQRPMRTALGVTS